ncbi:ArsR/SmtB family transcription factor [Companilactobacillus kimchii]|uniref:Transcription regulator n=2 Tax=Companilactobacillus kimchii TaxID=2801452 RepID=A0ABR5NSG8_9LACO|nr:winged helix-turn-helix domain-containing protein [Companilactobacillus kimchii]KAE9562246.1 transcriptional regulator [Companilactobacillus kimchii]KRK51128.1 transcription regulator [Companilactobacillus kimchii DSM 13961 = JCM 10707]OWF34390.1 putative HTH-type transcriptional regulator YceK [Companilactobacillus kimchii]GEO46313.1 transcriptional regulator [Companilactobacillus paralimentarius]
MVNTKLRKQIDEKQVKIFKALADPIRLEIIEYLKHTDHEIACGEVGKAVNISKTSGSYHFKLLESAGLINTRWEAREKYVTLNESTFDKYVTDFYQNI